MFISRWETQLQLSRFYNSWQDLVSKLAPAALQSLLALVNRVGLYTISAHKFMFYSKDQQ